MRSKSPSALTLDAPSTAVEGSSITVTVSGLESAEAVKISISGTDLASGTASARGTASVSVSLGSTPTGSQTLVATGQSSHRTGSRALSVVSKAQFTQTQTKRI